MWRTKWSRFAECVRHRPLLVLLLVPCLFLLIFYVASENDYDIAPRYPFYGSYNVIEGTVDGYLVWNSRCRMLSMQPLDSSIARFVKKAKYESCSKDPLLTRVSREANGSVLLSIESVAAKLRGPDLECCWSAVVRPKFQKPGKQKFDSTITVKRCEAFEGRTVLPDDVEVAMVSCKQTSKGKAKNSAKPIYENVHAVLNANKVRDRFDAFAAGNVGNVSDVGETSNASSVDAGPATEATLSRKLSVLVLGIDSVSRLNFLRSMPKTEKYLRETNWIGLNGYNKMGDNTFPNVMAILTGQNQSQAYARCKPTEPYSLDRCPFLWYDFRRAGYATAYGEDEAGLGTFNYLKVGFVDPPTDYYLRPYVLASERLLKIRRRFGLKYCTGPEISFERIMDYASTFARTFLGMPYFGFFWSTSVSHEDANGLSSMDERIVRRLRYLERDGVFNDTMIVFLSDHGMRWGSIRNTFVGWYEERLPFVYVRLPEWFRNERPYAHSSLSVNRNRLTSPFDLYETLREVLRWSSGYEAKPSPGCPACRSLFRPVPRERGCRDVGVSLHWCACLDFEVADPEDSVVKDGALFFFEHVENIVRDYKDRKGRRLCAKLRLKKLHRAYRLIEFAEITGEAYFYVLQATPGDGRFEVTMKRHENGSYSVSDNEVSRLNLYGPSAKCLDHGKKQYCHCLR